MTVKRIVSNVQTSDPSAALRFYRDILGLAVVMDHGWIVTLAGGATQTPQISFASEGGAGTDVPDLSIEVDDLDAVLVRVEAAGLTIFTGPSKSRGGCAASTSATHSAARSTFFNIAVDANMR